MRFSMMAAIAATVVAAPATAQGNDALLTCAVMLDDAKRLACYDAAMMQISPEARKAEDARRIAAAEAAKRKTEEEARAKRDAFGAEGLGSAANGAKLEQIDAKIAEVLTDGRGDAIFVLDNGQMWRQTEGLTLPPIRAGDPVRIKRGMMSGYRLTLPKQGRTVQAKRMR